MEHVEDINTNAQQNTPSVSFHLNRIFLITLQFNTFPFFQLQNYITSTSIPNTALPLDLYNIIHKLIITIMMQILLMIILSIVLIYSLFFI